MGSAAINAKQPQGDKVNIGEVEKRFLALSMSVFLLPSPTLPKCHILRDMG